MSEPCHLGPVLITGGTGHLGLAIADAFCKAGATTIAVGSSEERTRQAEKALSVHGDRARAIRADASQPSELDRLFKEVEDEFGPVAVLVNGAGINFNRMIRDVTSEDFDRLFAVNVRSMFLATQIACGRMISAGIAGRVINITSGNYRYARPDGSLYSATKAAMEMLNRGFALEYGHAGITVNAVAPGLVDRPDSTDAAYLGVAEYYRRQSSQHVLASVQDVASAVMFLASRNAASIAGETIVVDGGFSAGRLDFPRRT